MTDITPETVHAAITSADPVLEALSILLKEIAVEAVGSLSAVIRLTGNDPALMPGEYLLQAVLVEADKVFQPVSRETWLQIYDAYHAVKAIIDANPELAESMRQHKESAISELRTTESAVDALLDGQF